LSSLAGKRELYADRELAIEDEEGLRQTFLREVHGLRKHHFHPGDAGGRLEQQFGGDERRIARLVRLDVQTFGQRDLQGPLHGGAGPH
jgi:hypothetical protein